MSVTPLRSGGRAGVLPPDRRLRIALIAPPWIPVPPPGYGGTERVIALLADGLVARGHEVTLFAAAGSRTAARLVTPLESPPDYIGSSPDDDIFHTLAAFLDAIDVGQFDVIHDHTALGPAFGALLTAGPPVVHTLHGPWTPAARRKLGLVDERVHLVAISQAQRRANPRVRYAGVVHNGVDLDAHPFQAKKEDFLVFVGRINPEKGPEVAIDVARAAGLPLTMIVKRSEPIEWEHWYEVVVPRLDDDITVIEQPSQAVKVDIVGRARATLCPINWPEPFGLVLAESLACGTPVITRPLGAAPEIVVDGVTGFCCDTVEEMAEAVVEAKALSPEACRAHIEEHFSGAAMVRGYERVYASVLDVSRRPEPRPGGDPALDGRVAVSGGRAALTAN
jgi:glycosyltransferase involved in cell wall biosynthesis